LCIIDIIIRDGNKMKLSEYVTYDALGLSDLIKKG